MVCSVLHDTIRTDPARRAADVCAKAYATGLDAMKRRDFDLARTAFRWARRADPGNPVYIHAEAVLAQRSGNRHEAEKLYRRVIDVAERAFGAADPRTALVTGGLVFLYEKTGRGDEATAIARRVVDELDRGAVARAGIQTLARIAELCESAGRPGEAIDIYRLALAERRDIFGDRHPKVRECLVRMNALQVRIMERKAAARAPAPAGADRPVTTPRLVWRRREDEAGPALSA